MVFPQFAILLSLVIIVEIAAAIAGYIFRNKVSEKYYWSECLIGLFWTCSIFMTLIFSYLPLALSCRPGQSHWYDSQLQKWHGWIQNHCGQFAAECKFIKTLLWAVISIFPITVCRIYPFLGRMEEIFYLVVFVYLIWIICLFSWSAAVWTALPTGEASQLKETPCQTHVVWTRLGTAEKDLWLILTKFTRR